jgi:hypothetical protein
LESSWIASADFLAGESPHGDCFVRNVLTPIHLLLMVVAAHKQKEIYSAHGQLADMQMKSQTSETVPDVRAFGAAFSLFT